MEKVWFRRVRIEFRGFFVEKVEVEEEILGRFERSGDSIIMENKGLYFIKWGIIKRFFGCIICILVNIFKIYLF